MKENSNFIEMRGISKRFGSVIALCDVNLSLARGEVLGLVGDNAAGKSTLMKILSGNYQPDSGEIFVDSESKRFNKPVDARRFGIEMVYQDFALIPELSVTRNIFLGREITKRSMGIKTLDDKAMDRRAHSHLETLGLRIPPVSSAVRELSGGQQQAVAIARATAFNAKLVIMDEPTANLGASAIEKVRETILRLKTKGISVIIISHRLEDILTVGDRLLVMKQGKAVGIRKVKDTDTKKIVHMIVTGENKDLQ